MIYITADLHAKNHSQYATRLADGTNSRLKDLLDFLDAMSREANPKKDLLVVVGDVFHDRKSVEHAVIDRISGIFRTLSERFQQVYVIAGNHDLSHQGDGSLAISALEHGNVVVIRESGYVVTDDDSCLVFVPYTDNPDDFLTACKEFPLKGKRNYLFAHTGVTGGKVGPSSFEVPGKISLKSVPWKHYESAFFGHYHKHQRITDNAWYVGSPMQLTWGESGETKGFVKLDSASGKWDFVVNEVSPRFVSVTEQTKLSSLKDNDFVQIISSADDEKEGSRLVRRLSKQGFANVSQVVTESKEHAERIGLAGKTDAEMIAAFVEAVPPGKKLNTNRLADIGESILAEARARS